MLHHVDEPALEDEESAAQEDHAAKAQETWDRLLRLTAEFDNFRKRAAREKEEAMRYANHKLLERLLLRWKMLPALQPRFLRVRQSH